MDQSMPEDRPDVDSEDTGPAEPDPPAAPSIPDRDSRSLPAQYPGDGAPWRSWPW